MLLVHLNQFVPASRLIDELWNGAPPASADVTLRTHVSRLRRRLARVGPEKALVTRPSGYGLVLDPELVDSYRFERLAGLGQEALGLGSPERAAQLLRAALGLWRGEVLEDLGSPGYAQAEATRLDELRLVALESRIDADLQLGRHTNDPSLLLPDEWSRSRPSTVFQASVDRFVGPLLVPGRSK